MSCRRKTWISLCLNFLPFLSAPAFLFLSVSDTCPHFIPASICHQDSLFSLWLPLLPEWSFQSDNLIMSPYCLKPFSGPQCIPTSWPGPSAFLVSSCTIFAFFSYGASFVLCLMLMCLSSQYFGIWFSLVLCSSASLPLFLLQISARVLFHLEAAPGFPI